VRRADISTAPPGVVPGVGMRKAPNTPRGVPGLVFTWLCGGVLLSHPFRGSTIGAGGLNDRDRNGNRV
jgi:hypothetical protein